MARYGAEADRLLRLPAAPGFSLMAEGCCAALVHRRGRRSAAPCFPPLMRRRRASTQGASCTSRSGSQRGTLARRPPPSPPPRWAACWWATSAPDCSVSQPAGSNTAIAPQPGTRPRPLSQRPPRPQSARPASRLDVSSLSDLCRCVGLPPRSVCLISVGVTVSHRSALPRRSARSGGVAVALLRAGMPHRPPRPPAPPPPVRRNPQPPAPRSTPPRLASHVNDMTDTLSWGE